MDCIDLRHCTYKCYCIQNEAENEALKMHFENFHCITEFPPTTISKIPSINTCLLLNMAIMKVVDYILSRKPAT